MTKSKKTIRPLGDKVLITLVEKEKITASGIVLPDSVEMDKGMKEGKVVSTGPGQIVDGKLQPVAVKKGDIVLFQWGDEIKIEGKEYHLVNESQIVAIIENS